MTITQFLRARRIPKSLAQRTVLGAALAGLCSSASALAIFTLNPAGVALNGSAFTGDNVLISDYATVRFGAGNTFTENGFLSISGAQLGGSTLVPPGLNSNYGLYISFSGTGNTGAGDPTLVGTLGTFNTLTYTLYGYNGPATFGFDVANNPTETAAGEIMLATGSLLSGTVSTAPAAGGGFTPSAAANLTFIPQASAAPFFVSPSPFYNVALSSFTNTSSQVIPFAGGFNIRQGGGSFNFQPAQVPEPATCALMLAGLFGVGVMKRRPKATKTDLALDLGS